MIIVNFQRKCHLQLSSTVHAAALLGVELIITEVIADALLDVATTTIKVTVDAHLVVAITIIKVDIWLLSLLKKII